MKDETPVPGFRFAGIASGIKKPGRTDLALLTCDRPAAAAAVFTRNRVRAAPVELAKNRLRAGRCQAIVANSGNANACTGAQGMRDALATTLEVAQALDIDTKLVAPASTGVIGVPLPAERITRSVPALVSSLAPENAGEFAQAILTTDRAPKIAREQISLGKTEVSILGIAKGAGMFHPNMATTLGFLMTDADVPAATLKPILNRAVDETFNRMTVDGDTSTNDAVFLLASGASAASATSAKNTRRFAQAVTAVLQALGEMVVADGEGANHAVRIEVRQAPSDTHALKVAKTVATSSLVKTAIHGRDPNWGRILAAAGRAGVAFDPNKTRMSIGAVEVFARGTPTANSEADAAQVMNAPKYEIRLQLGAGTGRAHYWTCDLGHAYVTLNADYRT